MPDAFSLYIRAETCARNTVCGEPAMPLAHGLKCEKEHKNVQLCN